MRSLDRTNALPSLGDPRLSRCILPVLLAPLMVATLPLAAQSPAKAAAVHARAHAHKHIAVPALPAPALPATPVPLPPAEPELPAWPANEKPAPAVISWDSQGLRIEAANSSLSQILSDVATLTGAKIEGFDADQRVFGLYGPGPARVVLGQLLQGSGYNVVMIGDQGQGTPRQILLSSPSHAGAQSTNPAANNASEEDDDTDEQPQQQNPTPLRPGLPPMPGGQPRSPEQMREMQRQQMMQRQQGQPPQPVIPPN